MSNLIKILCHRLALIACLSMATVVHATPVDDFQRTTCNFQDGRSTAQVILYPIQMAQLRELDSKHLTNMEEAVPTSASWYRSRSPNAFYFFSDPPLVRLAGINVMARGRNVRRGMHFSQWMEVSKLKSTSQIRAALTNQFHLPEPIVAKGFIRIAFFRRSPFVNNMQLPPGLTPADINSALPMVYGEFASASSERTRFVFIQGRQALCN